MFDISKAANNIVPFYSLANQPISTLSSEELEQVILDVFHQDDPEAIHQAWLAKKEEQYDDEWKAVFLPKKQEEKELSFLEYMGVVVTGLIISWIIFVGGINLICIFGQSTPSNSQEQIDY